MKGNHAKYADNYELIFGKRYIREVAEQFSYIFEPHKKRYEKDITTYTNRIELAESSSIA